MRATSAGVLLLAAALLAATAAVSDAAARKKKLARPAVRESPKKASTPRLDLDAGSFRAAAEDARRSLSGLGDSTAGDRRKLGSLFGGLADSLRDAWNRLFGPAKKKF